MKHLLARASAAVLVAAAALTAACSNNDPMAPQAPTASRTPSNANSGPSHYIGASVTAGVSGVPSTGGPATGGTTTNSGYVVTWGKDGQSGPTPPGQQQ